MIETMLPPAATEAQDTNVIRAKEGTSSDRFLHGIALTVMSALSQAPFVCFISALGLLAVTLAYNSGRNESAVVWAGMLRWVGSLIIFLPVAARLFAHTTTRRERIGLIIFLGLEMYVVKLLYSPLEFKFADELQHWRTASDILQGNHLFQLNPILEVSPYYPGLENVTTALCKLSGLSIFDAGVLVIGAARLLFVITVYLFYERCCHSPRIASIAAVIFMTNPHYQFFQVIFAYQSLALPLAVLALFIIIWWTQAPDTERPGLVVAFLLVLVAVIVTHHITSYVLSGFLVLWTAVALFMQLRGHKQRSMWWAALVAITLQLLWMVYVAPVTFGYLLPTIEKAISQVFGMIVAEKSTQETFRPPSGPLWERLASITAVAVAMFALPFGGWQIWRKYRHQLPMLVLGIASLGYYGMLALRFTADGAELSGRLWSFLQLAIAFGLAVTVAELKDVLLSAWHLASVWWLRGVALFGKKPLTPDQSAQQHVAKPTAFKTFCSHTMAWIRSNRQWEYVVYLVLATMLYIGGTTAGWPPYWERIPGPYIPAGFERSIGPQGVAAATRVRSIIGPHNRILGDVTNLGLMGAYGEQNGVRGTSSIFTSQTLDKKAVDELHYRDIGFVVIDMRYAKMLPAEDYYYDSSEVKGGVHTSPLPEKALTKFNDVPGVSRIFDSGDILLFNVGALSYAQ
jgi:hypothetical protein